jgi:hypothetical protein
MRSGIVLALVAASLSVIGCAGSDRVVRVVDGHPLEGDFVGSDAYAWFLRGALAGEANDRTGALVAYHEAAARGEDDAEIWTRIGSILCDDNPRDPAANDALKRALKHDAAYGPAWAVEARCAFARGETSLATENAAHAATLDPGELDPQLLLARAAALEAHAVEARDRLVALTLRAGTVPAWDALAAWGQGHGDAALAASALSEVARRAPGRRAELGQRAVDLAGDGEISAARALAAAVLDASGDRSSGGLGPSPASSALVARLAIDEALLAKDADRARSRATRAHVGLDVVAARALLLGEPSLCRAIASPLLAADPSSAGARMVLAAAGEALGDPGGVEASLVAAPPVVDAVPEEVLWPFARVIAREGSRDAARRLVRQVPHVQAEAGDALVGPVAVELAVLGVLEDEELSPDARIELAARRLEVPDALLLSKADARHRLLALAIMRPLDPTALELAKHLAPAATHDPLVAIALVRMSLAKRSLVDPAIVERLVALNPADALVAAAALDAAKQRGDEQAIAPARARLTALARTPRERAHALE